MGETPKTALHRFSGMIELPKVYFGGRAALGASHICKRGMGNGEWGMGNGEWGMGNR
ncbi:hypothetical protein LYNGBM3L_11550 [Moorena producens 3L]|uniref:Uncharacterized protein n=1 Tax=Moorena producens 3L TaxID=489825 RepID=F4XKK6_9CYAN|nr:hypothetical protein LYNGBM3L_11550 [Moorena producens 3L]